MATKIATVPAIEPITLAEAKTHLRVDTDADDAYITTLITVARQYAEIVTRRALITQTWDMWLDNWPDEGYIEIPYPPLQSVTSVTYTDSAGNLNTFAAGNYSVDTDSEPGRIVLNYGESWPSVTLHPKNPIKIRFVAGYGDAGSNVPEAIRQGMLVDIADMYENRETVVTGTTVSHLPTVDRLYWPYRVLSVP